MRQAQELKEWYEWYEENDEEENWDNDDEEENFDLAEDPFLTVTGPSSRLDAKEHASAVGPASGARAPLGSGVADDARTTGVGGGGGSVGSGHRSHSRGETATEESGRGGAGGGPFCCKCFLTHTRANSLIACSSCAHFVHIPCTSDSTRCEHCTSGRVDDVAVGSSPSDQKVWTAMIEQLSGNIEKIVQTNADTTRELGSSLVEYARTSNEK